MRLRAVMEKQILGIVDGSGSDQCKLASIRALLLAGLPSSTQPVALVAGVAGGVGSAVRARFLAGGWIVFGVDLRHNEEFASDFIADLTTEAACAAAVAAAVEKHGKLNGIVVATGVWSEGDTHAASEIDYDRTMAVNVKGPFFLLSRALPHLKQTRGWATLLSSDAGIQGNRGAAIYCASKGAVSNMVRAVATEVAADGVRVNADIDTPMLRGQAQRYGGGDPDAYLRLLLQNYPQGDSARFVTAQEVAGLVFYLAQDEAAPITGANVSLPPPRAVAVMGASAALCAAALV